MTAAQRTHLKQAVNEARRAILRLDDLRGNQPIWKAAGFCRGCGCAFDDQTPSCEVCRLRFKSRGKRERKAALLARAYKGRCGGCRVPYDEFTAGCRVCHDRSKSRRKRWARINRDHVVTGRPLRRL